MEAAACLFVSGKTSNSDVFGVMELEKYKAVVVVVLVAVVVDKK